jgi:hypothetical protein
VTDVTWSRATAAPEDVLVPLSLGPLPDAATRLQFKVIQTYSNGDIDRWIQDWPEGTPEPDMPGPVLEVTGTAAVTTTSSSPSTATSAPTVTQAPTPANTNTNNNDDDSDMAVPIIIAVIVVVLGAAAFVLFRRRRP